MINMEVLWDVLLLKVLYNVTLHTESVYPLSFRQHRMWQNEKISCYHLTDPHVEVCSLVTPVIQHKVGVTVEESPHLSLGQRNSLHLLHSPTSQSWLPDLILKLSWSGLEWEHSAEKQKSSEKGRIKKEWQINKVHKKLQSANCTSNFSKLIKRLIVPPWNMFWKLLQLPVFPSSAPRVLQWWVH